jgi:hypothetical protein
MRPVLANAHEPRVHSDMPALYQQKSALVLRCSCEAVAIDVECTEQPRSDRRCSSLAENQREETEAVRSTPETGGSPMLLERLTAWTLVVVYYTVTCGAILLGLRGAL